LSESINSATDLTLPKNDAITYSIRAVARMPGGIALEQRTLPSLKSPRAVETDLWKRRPPRFPFCTVRCFSASGRGSGATRRSRMRIAPMPIAPMPI